MKQKNINVQKSPLGGLRGLVALITGGTRGIGLGIATELAKAGFDLALNGMRPDSDVSPVCVELVRHGVQVMYVRGDISKNEDRQHIVDAVFDQFGKINILVNNAGIAPKERKDILEATEESFEHLLHVNLQGPYFLTQLVANRMIGSKRQFPEDFFCLINVSSVSATVASVNRGEYCISKAGISMATKLWASRLGEFDIPVYEIRPGMIRTDMTADVFAKYDSAVTSGRVPQPRWGEAEDIGRTVATLAAGDLPYITGHAFHVDGGLHIRRS